MRTTLVCVAMELRLRSREVSFPRRPLLMGIVNLSEDSFSGDGTADLDAAILNAQNQVSAGADIIDLGAESARTNRGPISVKEEIARFTSFIERWEIARKLTSPRDAAQLWPPILSINTWRLEVIEELIPHGLVEMVNDMSGLPDTRRATVCANYRAALLIMHSVGEPKVPHLTTQWDDVMASMESFFADKIALAIAGGMDARALILDPGIDFAKQRDDNLTVYRELGRLQQFACPVMVPVSRKTVIGEVLDLPNPQDRDAGTIACISLAMDRGAQMFRVHNVAAAWQAVKALHALLEKP